MCSFNIDVCVWFVFLGFGCMFCVGIQVALGCVAHSCIVMSIGFGFRFLSDVKCTVHCSFMCFIGGRCLSGVCVCVVCVY